MDVGRLTQWQQERQGARPPTLPPAQALHELRGAITEVAGFLRTYTVGYLTVALYFVVTATNTTHEQLLIGKEITLPIVEVGVSLVGFYILAQRFSSCFTVTCSTT